MEFYVDTRGEGAASGTEDDNLVESNKTIVKRFFFKCLHKWLVILVLGVVN